MISGQKIHFTSFSYQTDANYSKDSFNHSTLFLSPLENNGIRREHPARLDISVISNYKLLWQLTGNER